MTAADGAATAVLSVDLGAIVANWRRLCAAHGGPTGAVVKADAYGTGAARVVPALHAAGCRHFFTAHLAEAVAVRALAPDALLAALNGPVPGSEPDYLAHGVTPVLGSLDDIARWSALARQVGRVLPALLHVDTGMARLGLAPADLRVLAATPALLDGVALRYVMTHLVSAEAPDDPVNRRQCEDFAAACARLPPAPRSVANSAGVFLGEKFRSDLARPGVALYGVDPTAAQDRPMQPVVELRARVLQVRALPAGEPVGYNATWRAARASRIALLGIGYADGWPRSLSNRGMAWFDGCPLPLVGRVSMDLTAVDVTDRPAVAAGAWLELIGPHASLTAVARLAGTNEHELLTGFGPRLARVWHG